MKTDRQQLEEMFTRAGVVFRGEHELAHYARRTSHEIRVCADDNTERHGLSEGYPGFETIFTFDDRGTLLQVGTWE